MKKVRSTRHSIHAFYLLLLLLLAACDAGGNTTQQGKTPTAVPATPTLGLASPPIVCQAKSANAVTLTMYYSSEKQAWMDKVVPQFNNMHATACDGPITVNAIPIGSGDSMNQIASGKIKPDIWSPAGSVWITLLNDMWQKRHGSALIGSGASDALSLVLSPVVIAMWKPEAQALGWPQKAISWSDIAALSTNQQGWAAYGHPDLGAFKFGHTHPDYSNSGLDAVIAENYAALGKSRGLTIDDVKSAKAQDFVSNVESSIVYYGQSTGFFADTMFQKGPDYLSAAVMYENLVVEANDGTSYPKVGKDYPSVVAIYPSDGTFMSDHPYTIPQADWVTPARRTSAIAFRNFLLGSSQQQRAMQLGFRPADPSIQTASPIDTQHGVDPQQPKSQLFVPSADVVNAIKASWNDKRRKVDVMLILDNSGSMADAIGGVRKIDGAKDGLKEFINLLGDSDGLGLTVFSTEQHVYSQISTLGPKRQGLLGQVDGIQPDAWTRLYDTIYDQFQSIKQLSTQHRAKFIIVLTDGQDQLAPGVSDQHNLSQLIQTITPSGSDAGQGVKIFTIAYGNDADVNTLKQIASASGGQEYPGNPQNIKQVYQDISTF